MRRPAGTTMLELLIGSGLLLLLTALLFQTVVPVMRDASRVDAKQENLQRLILTREYLNKRLRSCNVDRVEELFIEFYQPALVETRVGPVARISDAEMVDWDYSARYRIYCLPNGRVVDEVPGQPDTRRLLWNLGEGGALRFDRSALPVVQVEVRTLAGQPANAQGQVVDPWVRTFSVVLAQYRR